MKNKRKSIVTILCFTLVIALGFGIRTIYSNQNRKNQENKSMFQNLQKEAKEQDKVHQSSKNQRIVMIDGKLYYDTKRNSEIKKRCGTMDGEITSNIEENQIPNKNNQSNFKGNYGYQYGLENTIELNINGEWIVFESKK